LFQAGFSAPQRHGSPKLAGHKLASFGDTEQKTTAKAKTAFWKARIFRSAAPIAHSPRDRTLPLDEKTKLGEVGNFLRA
jgi:hypothetical protein